MNTRQARRAPSHTRTRLFSVGLALLLAIAIVRGQSASVHTDIDAAADAVEPRVITWRRHIHQQPELAFQELKTSQYIVDALREMPGIDEPS